MAMRAEGTSEEDARSKIWLVDSKGLIVKDRPEKGINEHKAKFAKNHAPIRNLLDVVLTIKPSVLIGKLFNSLFYQQNVTVNFKKKQNLFVFFVVNTL